MEGEITIQNKLTNFLESEYNQDLFFDLCKNKNFVSQLESFGLRIESLLTEVATKISVLPEVRIEEEVISRKMITARLNDLKAMYETTLTENYYNDFTRRSQSRNIPISRWPADHLSYRCYSEGFNAPLYSFAHIFAKYAILSDTKKGMIEQVTDIKPLLHDISLGVHKAKEVEALEHALRKFNNLPAVERNSSGKLKWKGKGADFGSFFSLLISHGYLEKPTKSYEKDAEFYLNLFDIDTTIGSLAKELSLSSNSESSKALPFWSKMPFNDRTD